MSIQVLPSKLSTETQNIQFDFTSMLAVSETISSQAVVCTVYSGTDASPSSVISGAATASGPRVSQLVTAGTVGVIYLLTCTVTTSAGQTLQITAKLAIAPVHI